MSRDHAKREQMSFAVRYVNVSNGVVNERFLGFTHAKDIDAASLRSLGFSLTLIRWSAKVMMVLM